MECHLAEHLKSTNNKKNMNEDPELTALSNVCAALSALDADSQQRVLDYAARKFGLTVAHRSDVERASKPERQSESGLDTQSEPAEQSVADDTDGISPVALKWMRRNGFTVDQLGHLFSLGTDDVDLVSKSVPGDSKNARTRAVVLLKGIAAYLSTGVARITAEQIKEACLHYDAYDSPNHAKYLKGMSSEVTGNRANGFTLTARGIVAGCEIIRELLGVKTE
jgi:hypothetical protein